MSQLPPGASGTPPASVPPNAPSHLSADTRAMMLFEANKKTALIAYILWFFLGIFGAHNFYLNRKGAAIAQLILSLIVVGLIITVFWVLIDAFLIPGWIRRENNKLAVQLGA
jgi:TM2 domain-containing membrane protein YozV